MNYFAPYWNGSDSTEFDERSIKPGLQTASLNKPQANTQFPTAHGYGNVNSQHPIRSPPLSLQAAEGASEVD
jgi:hypothetical protein